MPILERLLSEPIDYQIDFGTPERRNHGGLKLEPRDISNGGNIITTGLTASQTCVMDALKAGGYLGTPQQAERRYGTAAALFAMFCKSGGTRPCSGYDKGGSSGLVNEGDIGNSADIAESTYYAIMGHERLRYQGRLLRVVVIDGALNWPVAVNLDPQYLFQLHMALDILEIVMPEIEKTFDKLRKI